MPTWIATHQALSLIIAFFVAIALVVVVKNVWWRIWYPAAIFILSQMIKYRERKASRG